MPHDAIESFQTFHVSLGSFHQAVYLLFDGANTWQSYLSRASIVAVGILLVMAMVVFYKGWQPNFSSYSALEQDNHPRVSLKKLS
jgi:hypothetical protein